MRIKYSKQAEKFLKKQDIKTRKRLLNGILGILDNKGDIKKLENSSNKRLRIGNFRIIFSEDGTIISIIKIKSRGDVYK